MDPAPPFTLLVACQNSYWPSLLVLAPGVLYSSQAGPSVSLKTISPCLASPSPVLTAVSAHPPPKSMSKEWQEASNERARELNLDPITGEQMARSPSPVIIQTSFRYFVRGLFRKGICAIQVDCTVGIRGRSSGLRSAAALYKLLGHNQYSPLQSLTCSRGQDPRVSTVGWYAFRVRSLRGAYSALASFASFSFSPSFFSLFSSDSSNSVLPMLALLSTNA